MSTRIPGKTATNHPPAIYKKYHVLRQPYSVGKYPTIVVCSWLIPDFGGWFTPTFGQEKYEFLQTTVITLFDKNSSYQFYIRLCVKIFNQLFIFI